MLGKKFELWRSKYTRNAYADQFGIKHDAYVVHHKTIVTIAATEDAVGAYSGKKYDDAIWLATNEAGLSFRKGFDETSMSNDCWIDSLGDDWCRATNSLGFHPYINPDGTKAVPNVS